MRGLQHLAQNKCNSNYWRKYWPYYHKGRLKSQRIDLFVRVLPQILRNTVTYYARCRWDWWQRNILLRRRALILNDVLPIFWLSAHISNAQYVAKMYHKTLLVSQIFLFLPQVISGEKSIRELSICHRFCDSIIALCFTKTSWVRSFIMPKCYGHEIVIQMILNVTYKSRNCIKASQVNINPSYSWFELDSGNSQTWQ